jgi:hypothetical protein
MKTHVRTLWGNDEKPLWDNPAQRDALRLYLNDQGFYVLTGASDSLDVYAVEYTEPWDIHLLKKSLDKLSKVWYTLTRTKKEVTK